MLTLKKVSLSAFALSLLMLGASLQAVGVSLGNLKKKALLAFVAAAGVGTYQLYTKDTWKSVPSLAEDADLVETLKYYWDVYFVGQKGRDSVVKARDGADGRTYLVAKKKKAAHGLLGKSQTLVGLGLAPALLVATNYNSTVEQLQYALDVFGLGYIGNLIPKAQETAKARTENKQAVALVRIADVLENFINGRKE